MIGYFRLGAMALAIAVGLQAGAIPALAQQQQPFFAGKTIQLIVSTGTGGGQDANARLVARHWPDHIAGRPTIVVKNMPGAGHLRAANFLANQAPKDGTVIGAIVPAFLLAQVLESSKGIQFDAAKLSWIGSTAAINSTVYVWSKTPVQTLEDATRQQVLMGATGAGSYTQIYPIILNAIVGTRFKVIAGYATANDVNLAMERGEVQGRAGNNFNSLRMENPDWMRDGKIRFLAQVGLTRDPDYPDLPLMHEFGKTDDDKRLLRLFSADIAVGRPFIGPPGMASDRLEELQRTFDQTMTDPAFLKDAQDMHVDVAPVKGDELQAIVSDIVATPADVVARARQALMDLEK
jgi:tripartite-type tricarboxylate transporter receptor subunit TctC